MNQTVEHPLDIDLDLPSQGEPVHFFAGADVTEYRFYYAQAFAVRFASVGRIYLLLHFIGYATGALAIKYMHLPGWCVGVAQAF